MNQSEGSLYFFEINYSIKATTLQPIHPRHLLLSKQYQTIFEWASFKKWQLPKPTTLHFRSSNPPVLHPFTNHQSVGKMSNINHGPRDTHIVYCTYNIYSIIYIHQTKTNNRTMIWDSRCVNVYETNKRI